MKRIVLSAALFIGSVTILYGQEKKVDLNAGTFEVKKCGIIYVEKGITTYTGGCEIIVKHPGQPPQTIFLKKDEKLVVKDKKASIVHTDVVSDIRIEGIELIAKKKNFSEIEIKQEALQNIQSFSIGDVLQQLPGQFVQPFDNTQFKNIVFRTASGASVASNSTSLSGDEAGNKAFGVQLMVNDIALSNNENMQSYNSAYSSPFGINFTTTGRSGTLTPSQPNFGVDLREIPTENIESIEVIQGIPDAKYGDLTSGLIKVSTLAKRSPLRLDASVREGTYQFGLTRGFSLKNDQALNVSADYMNSITDPRTSLIGYDRFSINTLWGINAKNVKNKLSFSFSQNTSNGRKDPDDLQGIVINSNNKTFSLSNNFKYFIRGSKKKIFNTVGADVGVSYATQLTERTYHLNQGARPYGNALENSVYYAPYTPPSYENQTFVDGKPINIYINASADGVYTTSKKWVHVYSAGFNFRYGDNLGKGKYGTAGQFSTIASTGGTANGVRDYNYQDNVLATSQYAFYLQDNIFKRINNKHTLRANLGLRYDIQNGRSTVSPRINTSYQMGDFTLRAGLGLTSKAPSLNQLYTGPRYFDILLGDYRLPGYYTVGVMQTVVTPGDNSDLKPSKSWKTEIGVDYRLPFATLNLTGYYNKLFDGFSTISVAKVMDKAKVEISAEGTHIPTFEIVGTDKFYYLQNRIINGYESSDMGLELMMFFKKIEALNLITGFNASYVKTKSKKNEGIPSIAALTVPDPAFQYGLYSDTHTEATMARASFSFDYHLPSSGLIIGLRTDHFLIDKRTTSGRDIYPIGYIDHQLNTVMIPEAERDNTKYQNLFRKPSDESLSGLGNKTLHNVHFRVTKDFLSGFRISIYVNNVFNLKAYNEYGSLYTNFSPTSFGANVSYKF
ncbi:MAG: TonB-dependent receptor [Chryseobacterium sp.]|uniref:TonB-dependent receptor plug domain-containing protein n=1 Tax=Chryseobacterium sp. TaxID=1871047 RepID=UPI0025C2C015|nr:TonB-dependent receptor [Chryseobacterium sp.]MCJ7932746.1 TonB-dependent receptor [Chryseobacterium sp.]